MVATTIPDTLTAPQLLIAALGAVSVILWGYMWFKADQRYETKPTLDKRFTEIWAKIDRQEAEMKAAMLLVDARIRSVEADMMNANREVRKSITELRDFIQSEFMKLVGSVSEMKGQLNEMGKHE